MGFFKSREFLLVLFSALLFSFAFPPSPFGFLAYFALVPLLSVLQGISPKQAFKWGYLFGVITNVMILYWIIWQTFYGEYFVLPGSIGAYLILALYPAVWCWLLKLISTRWRHSLIIAPFLWVGLEYLRGLGQVGFPWLDIGYTQTGYLPMIQFASITGIQGISFWIVALNVLVYLLLKSKKTRAARGLLIVVLVLIPYLYGRKVMNKENSSETVKVALIQGNIDPNIKWDPQFLDYSFQVYDSLSKEAAKAKPDVIIWPETAAPCYLEKEPVYLSKVEKLSQELNTDLIVGTDDYYVVGPERYVFYNSSFWISPDYGLKEKYYKMQLVPFAERIPYSGSMRIFEEIELGQANFSPGIDYTLFQTREGNFPTLICYEIAFPDLVRQFVKHGADFIANITNDAWFGRTAGPYQHASMSIMRAVENRISIARCANTGISLTVDPYGRILEKASLFKTTNLVSEIPKRSETTFFTRHGPWLGKLCLLVSLLTGITISLKRLF